MFSIAHIQLSSSYPRLPEQYQFLFSGKGRKLHFPERGLGIWVAFKEKGDIVQYARPGLQNTFKQLAEHIEPGYAVQQFRERPCPAGPGRIVIRGISK